MGTRIEKIKDSLKEMIESIKSNMGQDISDAEYVQDTMAYQVSDGYLSLSAHDREILNRGMADAIKLTKETDPERIAHKSNKIIINEDILKNKDASERIQEAEKTNNEQRVNVDIDLDK